MILNFRAGMITNAGDHAGRYREATAEYLIDGRSDKQGWWVNRPGRVLLSEAEDVETVFAYKGHVFIVVDGELKWGRLDGDTVIPSGEPASIVFNSFSLSKSVPDLVNAFVLFQTREETIFVGDGVAPFVINVPERGDPSVSLFYLPKVGSFRARHISDAPSVATSKEISLVLQAVRVDGEQETLPETQGRGVDAPTLAPRTVISPESDPVKVRVRTTAAHAINTYLTNIGIQPNPFTVFTNITWTVVNEVALKISVFNAAGQEVRTLHNSIGGVSDWYPLGAQTIQWHGDNDVGEDVAAGVYTVTFRTEGDITYSLKVAQGVTLPSGDAPVIPSQVSIELTEAVPEADYIDVYASRRDDVAGYYWIARMENADDATLIYDFTLQDGTLTDELLEAGETPNWQYMAIDDFRCYAAERESNRLYFSYYDPENHERLFQNFTDFDDLELGGGWITGLHFLNDTHLSVYSSRQVHRYAVDPDIELIGVYDFITPGSDRGKSIGCTAPESIVNMGSHHYFLATNDYVCMLDERGLRPISAPVHGIFQTVRKPVTPDGELRLTTAVGFAHGEEYYLSLPLPTETSGDLPVYVPTRTMMFDTVTNTWWQDSFGVYGVSKTDYDRVLAVVDGRLVGLYEGNRDIDTPIRRVYKNNPYFQHSHSHWESVHIYALGAAEIDITAITEQGRREGELSIPNAADWWSQRLGLNLRGRYYQAEFATESEVPIDRITVNERPKR